MIDSKQKPSFNKKKLSKVIVDVLNEKGLTHKEFANLAELPSSSTVSNLIQGYYAETPALKTLVAIASNVLNKEVGEFIAYLYDEIETDNFAHLNVPISLVEIGIGEVNSIGNLGRVAAALANRLNQLSGEENY